VKVSRLLRRVEVILGQSARVDLDADLREHLHDLVFDGGAECIALD